MRYLTLVILSFLLIHVHTAVKAQVIPLKTDSIPLTELVDRNSQLTMDFPFEKVYVHFDKPYYAVGDTAWFKSYVTTLQNMPSPLSKILYLEIINSRDSLVETVKLPIIDGTASGSIDLNYENYVQENYHVRAYTQWMLNFPSEYFFYKNFPVGNALNKDLATHITFQKQLSGKNVKVFADLKLWDGENKTYKDRRVNWEVEADYERVARGRGNTNVYGEMKFDFSSNSSVPLREGKLKISMESGKNSSLNKTIPLSSLSLENDLQFFPEGGDLIAGLPITVAFKAIQENGLGIHLDGEIVGSDGQTITQISAHHLGMGTFKFTPQYGNTYFANVNFSDGTSGTFQLPAVKESGIALAVDASDPLQLKFTILSNEAYLRQNYNKGFYIVARNGGVIYYAAQSVLRNQAHAGSVAKINFPTGIVQLAILDASGRVLSERLTFVSQQDLLDLKVSTDKSQYGFRSPVQMSLQAQQSEEPVSANFSVAVIDESKVPFDENEETTILSSLLLNSDLTGYIEKPNYYFNPANEDRFEKLETLLLTQGYRRYEYKDLVDQKAPTIALLPEQSLSISGIIRRTDGMPLGNTPILLQIPERAFYKDGLTDQDGRFIFDNLIFQDSVEAVVNARAGSSIRDLMINVDGEPFPKLAPNVNKPSDILNLDSALFVYLDNSRLNNASGFLLREVEVESRPARQPSHTDHAALTGLSMMPDYTTQGDQLAGCNTLVSCIGTVSGLTYVDNQLFLSRNYNAGNRIPVEIYVSGMPVDVSYLNSLQPSGIASIEVFLTDGMSGINQRTGTSGVVVVNLKEVKKQTLSREEVNALFAPKNILRFNPKGYSVERSFYVPKYEGPRTSLQTKDSRSTVFWQPNAFTDEQGNAVFHYFTADDKGTYRVVVEGVNAEGRIGREVYRFTVE